jgi:hypothetical protein
VIQTEGVNFVAYFRMEKVGVEKEFMRLEYLINYSYWRG